MDCEQALEAVSAALDGELSPAERGSLEAHLSVCPECRALAEDLRVLTAALEETEAAPPPSLAGAVMERVAAEGRVVPISAGRRKRVRRWLGLAAMLALVICVGGMGLWLRTDSKLSGGATPNSNSASGFALPAPSSAVGGGGPSSDGDLGRTYSGADGFSESAEREPAPCDVEGMTGEDDRNAVQNVPGSDGPAPGAADPGDAPPLPASEPAPGEPMDYAFSNVQAVRVAGDAAAEVPMARVLGSVEAVQGFAEDFPDSGLTEQLAAYDAEYFAENRLLAVVVEEGSGSISHSIAAQGLLRDQVELVRIVPEVGTDDMATWVILAEVDSMFEDGDILEVVFSD